MKINQESLNKLSMQDLFLIREYASNELEQLKNKTPVKVDEHHYWGKVHQASDDEISIRIQEIFIQD